MSLENAPTTPEIIPPENENASLPELMTELNALSNARTEDLSVVVENNITVPSEDAAESLGTPEAPTATNPDEGSIGRIEPTINPEQAVPVVEAIKNNPSLLSQVMSPENRKRFTEMSKKGKGLAGKIYGALLLVPGVNLVVGKAVVMYNELAMGLQEKSMDKSQIAAAGLKKEIGDLDIRNGALEQSKTAIQNLIDDFKKDNTPGTEMLELKLREIDKQTALLANKKNKIQSSFEAQDNETKLFANKRDAIADKLINRFGEKLAPMEAELGGLQIMMDHVELRIAVTEARHNEVEKRLENQENQLEKVKSSLIASMLSEKDVKKATAALDENIRIGREEMRKEKELLAREKAKLNEKVAAMDARANPHRDKREEYIRIKSGRPLDMSMETRQRSRDFKTGEILRSHRRTDGPSEPESPYEQEALRYDMEPEPTRVESVENLEKARPAISVYITKWNEYLTEKYGKDAQPEIINLEDFLKTTRFEPSTVVEFKDLKKIIEKYYKFNKTPTSRLSARMDTFSKEKIETIK